jgi:hypothetical protein
MSSLPAALVVGLVAGVLIALVQQCASMLVPRYAKEPRPPNVRVFLLTATLAGGLVGLLGIGSVDTSTATTTVLIVGVVPAVTVVMTSILVAWPILRLAREEYLLAHDVLLLDAAKQELDAAERQRERLEVDAVGHAPESVPSREANGSTSRHRETEGDARSGGRWG